MKVGIYARVSTEKQEESLDEQVRMLVEFCERSKYAVYKVYSETGSGAKSKREMFMELMRDVEANKFDAVVVLKLDRFSRSMLDLLTSVERLKEKGVDFISVNDHIETTTPQGKLIFHIIDWEHFHYNKKEFFGFDIINMLFIHLQYQYRWSSYWGWNWVAFVKPRHANFIKECIDMLGNVGFMRTPFTNANWYIKK